LKHALVGVVRRDSRGSGCSSRPDAREIVRRSLEMDQKNQAIARNYTFLERQDTRMLDRSGKPKKPPEIRTFDVTLLEGSPYRRLVARNDRPLPPDEERKEAEKLRKSIDERRKETPAQRQLRIAEWERKQQHQRAPFQEIPDAFDLRVAGEETLNGREAYVIAVTPKPGYKPKLAAAAYFPKIKGKLWIDKRDNQWIKGEIETLDTISFGGILVRLDKGRPRHVRTGARQRRSLVAEAGGGERIRAAATGGRGAGRSGNRVQQLSQVPGGFEASHRAPVGRRAEPPQEMST
jgi:hypothetical protein